MTSIAPVEEAFADAPRLRIDPRRYLIVVAPHPDDEVIGFGGVVFDHVAAGGPVVIVTITDGDAFDPHASEADRQRAGAVRRAEQVEALAILGVGPKAILRLSVPDGLITARTSDVAAALRGLMRGFSFGHEPLVVAPWRGDWHPDHVATSHAVRRGIDTEIIEIPIWSWHRRQEEQPTWQALSVVPISIAAREAKRAAIGLHRSQLIPLPGGRPPILSSEFLADFDRPAELVVR